MGNLPCSYIGRLIIAKMAIPPKTVYMFNTISIKIPVTFIREIEKSTQSLFGSTKDHE
jgi:hypothetical protein